MAMVTGKRGRQAFQGAVQAICALSLVLLSGLAHAADFVPVLVYSSSGRFDNSFSEAAWKGAERFRTEFKVPYREVQVGDAQQAEKIIDRIAASDVDMIIAVGFSYQQAIANVARKYPGTKFVLVDSQAGGNNVESVLFGQHEGSFLVGMVAGLASKTGKLGFIGGMDVPVVRAFGCGFLQGARYANRNVQVMSDMVSSGPTGFNDPGRGAELAKAQVARGADVIFAAAGRTGLGVIGTARPEGPWAIGVDVNQNWVSPGAVLTSMVKRIDNGVYESLQAGYTGRWKAGTRMMGLKEGGVVWALDSNNRKLIGPDVVARVDRARREIIEGTLTVVDSITTGSCPVH